jgi:hypothetical protein
MALIQRRKSSSQNQESLHKLIKSRGFANRSITLR